MGIDDEGYPLSPSEESRFGRREKKTGPLHVKKPKRKPNSDTEKKLDPEQALRRIASRSKNSPR